MTNSELYKHILGLLVNHPGHTIVRHKNASGSLCYRIRDNTVSPVANFSDTVFAALQENDLLIKLNEREWQLNLQALSSLKKK